MAIVFDIQLGKSAVEVDLVVFMCPLQWYIGKSLMMVFPGNSICYDLAGRTHSVFMQTHLRNASVLLKIALGCSPWWVFPHSAF